MAAFLLAGGVLGVSALVALGIHSLKQHMIYQPTRADTTPPRNSKWRDVQFASTDGKQLTGWFYRHPTARGVVLFCHGNAGHVCVHAPLVDPLLTDRYSVLVFDYRGYGASTGTPSERGLYRDGIAAYQYLRQQQNYAPAQIVVHGYSLGTGVASYIGKSVRVAGVVLQAGFTSLGDVASDLTSSRIIGDSVVGRIYDTFNRLQKPCMRSIPICIVHSPQDELIPYTHARQNFAVSCSDRVVFISIGGSHCAPQWSPDNTQKLFDFIDASIA
jgi:fermentation-respiration switch protein FrsA (DUF1100 family)